MSIIQYRREYVVDCSQRAAEHTAPHRFTDNAEADLSLKAHVEFLADSDYAERSTRSGDFGGQLAWYIDDSVPATFFDEKVTEYADCLHDGTLVDDMPIDRDERYLLVESNRTGGYWLSTDNDPVKLVNECEAISGEYPADWDIHEVWDLEERRELHVDIAATIHTDED